MTKGRVKPKREALVIMVTVIISWRYDLNSIFYRICGITLVNALSTYFTLATYRGDYYHEIEFKEGKKTNDVREKTSKTGKKH